MDTVAPHHAITFRSLHGGTARSVIARRRVIYASIYGLAGVIAFRADRLNHQELGELARATGRRHRLA